MASSQDVLPPPVPHPTLIPKSLHSSQGIIEHPNGSDGWLPAESFNLKQDESDNTRRSTAATAPKRKSAFGTRSPARHPATEPRSEGVVPVNGTPATAAIPDEELQNRAVLADNNLTPKQK